MPVVREMEISGIEERARARARRATAAAVQFSMRSVAANRPTFDRAADGAARQGPSLIAFRTDAAADDVGADVFSALR